MKKFKSYEVELIQRITPNVIKYKIEGKVTVDTIRLIKYIKTSIHLAIISAGALVMFLPFFWMVSTGFKPQAELITIPIEWIPSRITLEHFKNVLDRAPIFLYLVNSLLVVGVSVTSSVFISTMGGYGFARFRNKGGQIVFLMLLTGLMVSMVARIIPLYLLTIQLRLNDTYLGIMLPNLFSIYGIFLMRQYILAVPLGLIDAARIDGASEPRIFFTILLPLVKPAIAALVIIKFLFTWNDFLWPLVVTNSMNKRVITVGVALFSGFKVMWYGEMMAISFISVLPILIVFLIFQRRFIEGVALTGFKY